MRACITPTSEDQGQKEACKTAGDPSNPPQFCRLRQRKLVSFALPMIAPPLLVSFSSVDSFVESLPQLTRETYEEQIRVLVEKGHPPAVSIRTVSTLFGVSAEFVGAMFRAPQRYYRSFKIKKGKKTRQIQAPRVALKVVQRWIGAHLSASVKLPDCVYGFVQGRSVVDAAQIHCRATWVYSLDIRDFFPNTSADQVFGALTGLGYAEHGATLITRLCTFNGCLPQGSPASPVLSNLVFMPFDIQLQDIARVDNVRYTRYADDIVFSGQGEPPHDLAERVKAVVIGGGWSIAPEKERLCKLPSRLKVHGLLVHGNNPRLTKGYRNRVRALKHLLESGKIKDGDLDRVRGHLSYADFVAKSGANS